MITAVELRVADRPEPMGVDSDAPAFSWIPSSEQRLESQTAYRILVASSKAKLKVEDADVWDSGRVESDQTLYIPYGGTPLESAREYWWAVKLWDKDKKSSEWSGPARFGTGLRSPEDWKAAWIGSGPAEEPRLDFDYVYAMGSDSVEEHHGVIPVDENSSLLRTEFEIQKPVQHAVLFVSGLGFYRLRMNGCSVGSHVHSPSKTDYRKQVLYDAFDVTENLFPGENAIGLMLGNGWYNPLKKYWKWNMQWHGSKRAILQLHVTYTDGTREVVATDEHWKTAVGPVLKHCLYDGETYDARQEQCGWDAPGFDDSAWTDANRVEAPGGQLCFHSIEPIAVTQTIRPKNMWEASPGVFMFDMGQNFSGFVQIHVQGSSGTRIQLRHAENIDAAGRLDPTTNMRALNTDVYICKGEEVETYEPYFTYHGFQYVEVSGWPGVPTLDSIVGRVIHTACRQTGEFRCSSDLVNRIHQCTVWSQRSNMMGLPTDDNQRDERLGWMADGHLGIEQCLCNFDSVAFYRKWLRDIKAAQKPNGSVDFIVPWGGFDSTVEVKSPVWSSAYPIVAWHLYCHTGDVRIIEEHLDGICAFVDYLSTEAEDNILPADGYGDHESIADGHHQSDPPMASTAYYYVDALLASRMAAILQKDDVAKRYRCLADEIREAFNQRFFVESQNGYGKSLQTELILPLWAGIAPEGSRNAVFNHFVADLLRKKYGRLYVGILGAKHALDILMDEERPDVAWTMINREDFPGWGAMVHNRTTLSETWHQTGTNNHVMWGHVDTWFYRELGGIRRVVDNSGFKHIVFQPFVPSDMDWVHAALQTPCGRAACSWVRREKTLSVRIHVPANTTAELRLPAESVGEDIISEMATGRLVWHSGFLPGVEGMISGEERENRIVLKVGSGTYEFRCDWTGWPANAGKIPSGPWFSPYLDEWFIASECKPGSVAEVACVSLADALKWTPIKGNPFVNIHDCTGEADGLAYLANRFTVDEDGSWVLHLAHDGGVRVFVDGTPVACTPTSNNPATPVIRTSAPLTLSSGEHEIAIAFDTVKGGNWGLWASFEIPRRHRFPGRQPVFPYVK